LLLKSQ